MTTPAEALDAGVVVLDGGLATHLEGQGHDLTGGLWSARVLREDPDAVLAAHRAFFAAGAQVATTASYQVSELSLARAGVGGPDGAQTAEALLRLAVDLARRARDEVSPDGWVAGSVGPYGASLADGSEYTGWYDLGDHATTTAALRAFHRPRMEVLLDAGVDVLACETVPRLAEVEALAAELEDLAVPAWVSVTPAAGRTRLGEPLADVFARLAQVPTLVGAGVNCCAPQEVPGAVRATRAAGLTGVAYPNSGEDWLSATHVWQGRASWDAGVLVDAAAAGARLVGGCCRVTPADITTLVDALRR